MDRIIRIIVAIVVTLLVWQNVIQGTLAYVLLAIAGIFLLTSFVSFCPLYRIFGISTCKVRPK